MNITNLLPPDPQHAVLKKIHPWDKYEIASIIQWLYEHAQKTGFTGTLEDFKQRYGAFMEAQDPQDYPDLIDNYEGLYYIVPLIKIQQILETANKVLNKNIIIDAIPYSETSNNAGGYTVTIG